MTKDSNKKPIIIACSIIAAIIVVVVAAVLLLSNKGLNDNFFTSDGSKYVLSMDSDEVLGLNIDDYDLKKAHLIYFCSNEICEILNINRFVLGKRYPSRPSYPKNLFKFFSDIPVEMEI